MSVCVERLSPVQNSDFVEEWYGLATEFHFWMFWRQLALTRFFRALEMPFDAPLRVLDVGAGNGAVQRFIEAQTNWVVDCVDLNLAGLSQGPEGRGRRMYYNIHDRRPGLVGRYDMVLVLDVLEHLPETKTFLESTRAHLKPGGHLIANVPALQEMFSEYDRHVGHLRRYDTAALRTALEEAGLKVEQSRYWGYSLLPVLWLRKHYLQWRAKPETIVKDGFQPPSALINLAFKLLARIETWLQPRPRLGSSLLMSASS